MAKGENWVHYTPSILFCNRLVHMEAEPLNENEEPEDAKKRVEAADPFQKRLK